MSPSVTHIQSPISSQNESQSTHPPPFSPNPNPNFHKPPNFSSFASSFSDSTSFNSSNIGIASDRASNNSFRSSFESRVSSVESKVAMNSSSRSRPRLVKVRRQNGLQHARAKLVKDNTNRGNDVNDIISDVSNLNFNKSQFGNSVNFVFGNNNNNNSNMESNTKFGGFGLGNKESVRKVENLDFDGLGKSSSFVFVSDGNVVNSSSSFSSDANEATKNEERCDVERKNGEEGTKSELRKFDNVAIVFGATQRDSLSNSNWEKKEDNVTSFVFGACGNGLSSSLNSEQVGINGSFGKSFSFDDENLKSTSHRGDNGKGFVFSASKNDSASIADAVTPQSGGKEDQFSFLHDGKTNVDGETEPCNSKFNGVFVFGSGSKGSSHFSRGSQPGNDMKNLNFKKTGNRNGELKSKGNSKGSASSSMFNFVFGNSNNLGDSFNCHANKMSDEMQKMNIHDSEIVDDAGTFKSSRGGLFSNLSDKFMFLSDNKTSVSFTGNSASTSHHFQNANVAVIQTGQVVKNIDAANNKNCEEKVFGLGNDGNNVGSFGESVENTIPDTVRNRDTKYGTGLFSGQSIPSFSSFGTRGKENKSINLTENGLDVKQNLGNQTSLNNGVGGSFYPSSSSSMGFGYQPFDSVYEAPTGDRAEKKDKEFTFTSTLVQQSPSFAGFRTPNLNMPANLFSGDGALRKDKEVTSTNTLVQPGPSITGFSTPNMNIPSNLFSGVSMKLDFSISNMSAGGRRLKKTRGKLRQHKGSRDFKSQKNEEPLDCGSPMDFSPYQEASCADASHSNISSGTANEGLDAAREGSGEREGDRKWSKENEKGLKDHHGIEPQINCNTGIAAEARASLSSVEKGECDGNSQYCSASNSQSHDDTRYSFTASSSAQNNTSASTRRSMKKYRMKIGHGSDSTGESWKAEFASSSVKFADLSNGSIQSDGFRARRVGILNTQSEGEHWQFKNEKTMKQDLNEVTTIEACEKWRISGNQAYRRGNFAKAENLYTKCINAITQMKTPECCIKPLVLCYSNRAATHLCIGRIREALRDCNSAASLDSNFQKVQMRAANCHLLLGEVEDAMSYFNKCLESSFDVCLDRRIMIEAADGVQKSQVVGLLDEKSADSCL